MDGRTDADGFHHGVEETERTENSGARLRLVPVRSQGSFLCSIAEIPLATLLQNWSEYERTEAERYLAKSCFRDAVKLERLGCVDAFALGSCKGTQNVGDKDTDGD